MNTKKLIQILGFKPKENTSGIFHKTYSKCDNYEIEIDFEKENFNFGDKIKAESKTTQNFSQAENWVVLECVNRLLEKGYQPQNITLEKTWATGHGTSGRLDILVTNDDGSAYLMIECKTWGAEFDKEFKNLEKNGGQLFTYFQQDKNAEILMLYASELDGNEIKYRNEIVKIEEDYRQTGNVRDLYERWNKLPKSNGVFDNWASPYEFVQQELRLDTLEDINRSNSAKLFHNFMKILRKNTVSDKPNAFNKIFNLFICKIYDEWHNDNGGVADFVVKDNESPEEFIARITRLYEKAMFKFLQKEVIGLRSLNGYNIPEAPLKLLEKILVQESNEFAIIEIVDEKDFIRNTEIVKEIVRLLQDYKIRYDKKNRYLSDFFELLLTTGLKQEAGQFFTPIPIVRFILKSLPINLIVENNLYEGTLPKIIDYASGSGHFLHESMDEIQYSVERFKENRKLNNQAKENILKWKTFKYSWANESIYGIEKDYRLSKVAKVGCYMHGDGIANIINGDGLDDFYKSKDYIQSLKLEDNKEFKSKDNPVFDIVVSNPPFSVNDFKWGLKNVVDSFGRNNHSFDLYNSITDQSSEIECLFIERTKQLLRDGGVAGIILPSSILSNTGIYTQTREIILKYFDVLAIAEMGSNTFMATGTNTVTLFLKRRNNADAYNVEEAIKKVFVSLQDVTINGIEKPLQKYVSHVWDTITIDDYKTLLQKTPNEKIQQHEIYKEYIKKIPASPAGRKAKNEQELWNSILALEQNKLLYFIITYPQKLVLVKTGEKDEEKRFIGYEFSNRRGSEGIHPMQRSKSIDQCTQLYDADSFSNPEKASTYIYKAFNGELDLDIAENLKSNITYQNLVDMLTFDRVDFEKNISLTAKKKVKFDDVWKTSKLEFLSDIADIQKGKTITEAKAIKGSIPVIAGGQSPAYYHNESNREGNIITVSASGAYAGFVNYFNSPIFASDCNTIKSKNEELISTNLIYHFLKSIQKEVYQLQRGQAQPHVYADDLSKVKIPLPPKDIQKKIVSEIELLEQQEQKAVEEIESLKDGVFNFYKNLTGNKKRLDEVCELKAGQFVKADKINKTFNEKLYPCYGGNGLRGYVETFTNEGQFSLVGRQGALCGNVHLVSGKFHATEHALVAYPKKDINKIWLHYQLIFMNLNQFATGTAQPGLSVMNLNPIEISVPTIKEQEKIVAEIEKIEKKIADLEKEIEMIPKQKELILKKYLE